jgi:hypothetical protein
MRAEAFALQHPRRCQAHLALGQVAGTLGLEAHGSI